VSTNLTRALTSSRRSLLARALKSAIALAIVSCFIVGASTAAVSAAGAATAAQAKARKDSHEAAPRPHAYLMRIDHFTIDKSPRLQAYALKSVLQAANAQSCQPGLDNSAAAKPSNKPAPHAAAPLRLGFEG
jgi:hypothetical protein